GGIPSAESGGIVNRRRHRFLLHRLLIGVDDQGFVAEFLPFLPLIHPFSSFLAWASPPAHPWLIFTGCPVWYGNHRDLSRGSSHPMTGRVFVRIIESDRREMHNRVGAPFRCRKQAAEKGIHSKPKRREENDATALEID